MLFPNAGVEINPAFLLLLGLMVGVLSGFFGVGAGFLITGGLLVFGVPPIFAVGTGLTVIMGSSIINALKHRRLGNVDYTLGALMIIGSVPGLVLAKRLNSQLEDSGNAGPVISYLYVAFLAVLGLFILYDYLKTRSQASAQRDQVSTAGLARRVRSLRIPPDSIGVPGHLSLHTYVSLSTSHIQRISIWVPVGLGFGVGFLAGLLGAGGGFILLPALIFVLGLPAVVAVGTGLLQIAFTGTLGTVLYSLSNNVDLLMALIMLATASLGSQLGVTATRFVDGARIRSLFGVTILSASVAIALRQASASLGPEFLATLASVLLLSMSGAMCIVIAAMLMVARNKNRGPSPLIEGKDVL